MVVDFVSTDMDTLQVTRFIENIQDTMKNKQKTI